MPTFDAAAGILRERLADNFSAYPIAWPNADFTPPVDGSSTQRPYIAFHALEGEAFRVGGTGRTSTYRHPGIVRIQIFTPLNTGDGLSREIADTLATIFRKFDQEGVRCLAPYYSTVGRDAGMWLATMTVPFQYDLTA